MAAAPNGTGARAGPPPPADADVEVARGADPAPAADAAAAPTDGLRHRRLPAKPALPTVAKRHRNPMHRLYEARPDVVTQKTRKPEWRQLKSRWRWFHALFFWAGPPAYLVWRVWPVLAVNMAFAFVVAADHVLRVTSQRVDGARTSILPNISEMVIDSGLVPMVRFMLFATSMILTLRLGRVYERWWLVRQSFSAVGSAATSMAQRVTAWADAPGCAPRQRRLAADFRRWAVVYHFSILHVCQNASAIHPDGARLLEPEELAIYGAARKGRQIAAERLVQILSDLDLPPKKFDALEQLLQRAVASAGACTGVRFQSMPYALTILCTGFVELFLLALVLLMVQGNAPGDPESVADTVFTVVVVLGLYFCVCLLFLGADEVANQLESLFEWLPLYDIVQTTERDVMRVPAELAALKEAERAALARRGGGGEGEEGEEAAVAAEQQRCGIGEKALAGPHVARQAL